MTPASGVIFVAELPDFSYARMQPAPLPRRLAAAVYDGLLLLALWMVALLLDVVLRDLIGLEREWHALRAYVFLIGFVFFGWFWTHGGQTLGMRAWRLRLRRPDGGVPRWTSALARYATMLVAWGVCLTPAVMQLPRFSDWRHAVAASIGTGVLTVLALVAFLADRRRRFPQDWISGSDMIVLPKPGPAAAATSP